MSNNSEPPVDDTRSQLVYSTNLHNNNKPQNNQGGFLHAFKWILITFGIFVFVTLLSLALIEYIFVNANSDILGIITFGIAWIIIMILVGFFVNPSLGIKYNFAGLNKHDWKYIGIALGILFFITNPLINIIRTFVEESEGSEDQFTDIFLISDILQGSPLIVYYIMFILIVGIIIPIVEELLFRGILFQGLRKKINLYPSIAISSLFFGAMHIFGDHSIKYGLIVALNATLLGAVMAYIYEKTNNLWTAIIIHMINNLLVAIFIVLSEIVLSYLSS